MHSCHTCQAPVCISKIGIFRQLTLSQQQQVIANVFRKHYKKGEIVVSEGDHLNKFVVVSQGSFKCYINHKDGKQKTLYYLHLGDFFGQQSLFDRIENPYTVEAIEDAGVCMIDATTIESMISAQPEFALSIIKELSSKVQSLESELSHVTLDPLETRLSKLLWELSKDFGVQSTLGMTMKLPLTQQEIGMRLGVTRESVSRALKQLERTNKIKLYPNKRVILL